MNDYITGNALRKLLGVHVARAATTLPQGATDDALFTIAGGRVLIVRIIGEVTVAIANAANATKLKFNPDATGSDVDICATLDIDNDPVGELYSITGDFSDAMLSLRNAIEVDSMMEKDGIILPEGAIEIDCVDGAAGEIAWDLWYIPVDYGASVVAA